MTGRGDKEGRGVGDRTIFYAALGKGEMEANALSTGIV